MDLEYLCIYFLTQIDVWGGEEDLKVSKHSLLYASETMHVSVDILGYVSV